MRHRLGKKSARPGAVSFKFASYFNKPLLPVPPKAFGHYSIGLPWGMLANDHYGDCVWAGAAHETMVWTHEDGKPAVFTDQCVLSDYSAVTGFDPSRPDTDQGTDMQIAASYRRKTGIIDAAGKRHKIDAYVALRIGDDEQLARAVYLLGAVGVGLRLPASAETQFDHGQPWTVVPGDTIEGGHYVPVVGRNSEGNLLAVTWGRLQAMTPVFYSTYSDESVAYLSLEALTKNLSPEGFDADQLRADLAAINSTTMETEMDGTQIDFGEVDAVELALKNLADEKAGWYRSLISDDFLHEVAATAVAAAESYRNGKSV